MAKKETNTEKFSPEIGKEQIALLEKLCNAVAVSGDEHEVRQIVLEAVRPVAGGDDGDVHSLEARLIPVSIATIQLGSDVMASRPLWNDDIARSVLDLGIRHGEAARTQ